MIKNFQYGGGLGELENEHLITDQFFARNVLRNALVELDRATREEFYKLTDNPHRERIQAINAEIESLRQDIRNSRVPKPGEKPGKWRKSMGKGTPQAEKIAQLEQERKDLRPIEKAARLEMREKNAPRLAELEQKRRKTINDLWNRANAGYKDERGFVVPPLYNMNSDEIVTEHKAERTAAMKNKTQLRFKSFRDVRKSRTMIRFKVPSLTDEQQVMFDKHQEEIKKLYDLRETTLDKAARANILGDIRKLTTDFKATIHRKQGWTEEDLYEGNTMIRIERVDGLVRDAKNPTIWDKGISRTKYRTRVHLRVGSNEKGKPIWASIPFVFHRPLPVGAIVKEAAIGREKIGSRYRWNLTLTVIYNEQREEVSTNSAVAVDLGWAQGTLQHADGRIRVAGILGSADEQKQFDPFELPAEYAS